MQDFQSRLQDIQKIREEQGEAAFQAAVAELAKEMIHGGGFQKIAEGFQETIKAQEEAYEKEAQQRAVEQNAKAEEIKNRPIDPLEGDQNFLGLIQQSIPAMRSQAQFTAFMACFDALRGLVNAIFGRDQEAVNKYKAVMEQSLVAATKVTEVTQKLQDVPEAATSKLADAYKQPPTQFQEYDTQRQLLSEVENIKDLQQLSSWWVSNRQRIDEVRTPMLRNPLIDAVRAKKEALS